MLERLKARFAFSKRKRLLKRLKTAIMNDRTESIRRQRRGLLKPEFLGCHTVRSNLIIREFVNVD